MTVRRIGMRVLTLGLAGLTAVTGLTPLTAQAAPDPGRPVVAGGDGWRVERVGGQYRITLRLAAPMPLRDAMPVLAVDGRPVGTAKQSADRRTVSVLSSDSRAATAREVSLRWSSGSTPAATPRRQPGAGVPSLPARGKTLPVDPGTPGRYGVRTMEYDLGDEAIELPGIGRRSELRGRVYAPVGATGARPLVIFLHGRHEACYGKELPPHAPPWPCAPGSRPVPSYRGYDAPAEALASHGYQVVSISANAINAWDFDAFDAGALARAQLTLAHLDLWRRWSVLGGGPFGLGFGRVDLGNIGLMGHSRGGEGVVRAALLNAERRLPYGIRAVLPLAPTDFTRPTLPGVAMSVLLPYCDGDVLDLEGQHYYDDTRYAAGDRSARSAVLMMGANHNYFNTEWTPGQSAAPSFDDWMYGSATAECGERHPARLKALEQQAAGRAYIAGFFRLQLGGERRLLPLLDGSNARAASAGRATVRVSAQAAAPNRLELARFDRPLPAGSVTGRATARVCAGARLETVPLPVPAPCMDAGGQGNVPHWTPAAFVATSPTTAVTRLAWTGPDGRLRLALPPGRRDVRRYSALTFRATTATGARPDLTVRVTDGRGRNADVAVSALSDALAPLPGNEEWILPKTMLRGVRIPLTALRRVDLRDLRTVELRTDRTPSGAVFLSDLAFGRPSLGRSGPSRLPRLSVPVDVRMGEGNSGTRSADFTIVMSRPSRQPVSVHAELFGDLGPAITPVSRRVLFAPGQTRAKVSVPITPNTRDDEDNRVSLVLSVPHNALVADSFATGTVLDDDPEPRISVGPAVADEQAKVLRFPLRLSEPSNRDTGVTGTLVDGTAVVGRDFTSVYDDGEGEPERYADGALAPGRTTGWVEVPLVDDQIREPTETFTLEVTPLSAVLTGPSTVTGTIRAND